MKLSRQSVFSYLFVGTLLVIGSFVFVRFFENINIEDNTLAMDYLRLYPSFEGGWLRYGEMRQAPWSIVPMLPLGLLNEQAGWGMLSFITVVVLVISVPRHRNRLLYATAVFLAVLSYPNLRTIADGNFEIVSTIGVLMLVAAYRHRNPVFFAAAALMASSKPQVSVLVLLVAGLYAVAHWEQRKWLTAAGITLVVVVISLIIWGRGWYTSLSMMEEYGTIMDSSLISSFNRTQIIPSWLTNILRAGIIAVSLWLCYATRWTLSRQKAGMLVAASLLIAPYAAGNSALTVYVVGVIPLLFQREWRWLSVVLIVPANALFLMLGRNEWLFNYSAYYWTAYFVMAWVALGWVVWQTERPIAMPSPPEPEPA